jgi:hypothetical protein
MAAVIVDLFPVQPHRQIKNLEVCRHVWSPVPLCDTPRACSCCFSTVSVWRESNPAMLSLLLLRVKVKLRLGYPRNRRWGSHIYYPLNIGSHIAMVLSALGAGSALPPINICGTRFYYSYRSTQIAAGSITKTNQIQRTHWESNPRFSGLYHSTSITLLAAPLLRIFWIYYCALFVIIIILFLLSRNKIFRQVCICYFIEQIYSFWLADPSSLSVPGLHHECPLQQGTLFSEIIVLYYGISFYLMPIYAISLLQNREY